MPPFVILFALAILAALSWLGLMAPANGSRARNLDAGLVSLAGGLVASRAVFVISHFDYFAARPAQSLWFWQGGLSGFGAAVGAVAGLGLYCLLAERNFWKLADQLILPSTLLVFTGWLGCLLEGCAYGVRLETPSWIPPTPDLVGMRLPRWPTQSAGALASITALMALLWARRKINRPGTIFAAGLMFHGGVALLLSLVRADPVPSVAGLRGDGLGAAILIVGGLGALLVSRRTR